MAQHRPLFSRIYRWASPLIERGGIGQRRRKLLDGLTGEVLDLGAGTGVNFVHYPESVTHIVAVEPDPYLRNIAIDAAQHTRMSIDVVGGRAESIPMPDASIDAVITTLVLCSVTDVDQALAEIRRVLRPGGELRFLEHGRGESRLIYRCQRVLDATVWPYLFGGCHLSRDIRHALGRAGFVPSTPDGAGRFGYRRGSGIWVYGTARAS
ncbi:MAG: class I SAM-dependent methyltransferase [Nitriliruptoraceae bacterium]